MYGRRRSYSTRRRYNPRRPIRRTRYSTARRYGPSKTRRVGTRFPRRNRIYRNPSTSTSCVPRFTKFIYHDTGFTSTLATATWRDVRLFRGNSLYDPDATGVGITAYYLTELLGDGKYFNNYCVMGSKITIYATVVNTENGTTANIPKVRCALFPSSVAAPAITTLAEVDMQHNCKKMVMTGDTSRRFKIVNYSSTRSNLMPGGPTDIEWYGTVATNPNRQWYWYLVWDAAELQSNVTVHYDVYIKYYTRMIDRSVVQY